MNTTEQKQLFRQLKIVKMIQMIVLIIMEILFFIILVIHPSLKNSLYSNPALFALCAIMWFAMIFSFIGFYYDFSKIKSADSYDYLLEKAAYLDTMTGIPNRYSCDLIFKTCCNSENLDSLGCGILEISNLNLINSQNGHDTGDEIIQDFCNILDEVGHEYGFVGRNSGNEYLAIFEFCDKEKMERFFTALNARIKLYNQESSHIPLEIAYAYVLNSELHSTRFADLITVAYNKLHHLT